MDHEPIEPIWYTRIAREPSGNYRERFTFGDGPDARHRASLKTPDRDEAARRVRNVWQELESKARKASLVAQGHLLPEHERKKEMTLGAACQKYLDEYAIPRQLPSLKGIRGYQRVLKEVIGENVLLSMIDTETVAKVVRKLEQESVVWRDGERPMAENTMNKHVSHLRAVMRRAARHWKVKSDWAAVLWSGEEDAVMLPEPDFERTVIRDFDTEDNVRAALDPDTRPVFDFAALTGMRTTNAFALTWAQVRWDDKTMQSGTIRVRLKSKVRDRRAGGSSGRIKTYAITPGMAAILRDEWGRHPTAVFTYVCRLGCRARRRGQRYPFTHVVLLDRWSEARTKLGLPSRMRFYDATRASFATRLDAAGWRVEEIQEAMGHADPETTRIYIARDKDAVPRKLEDLERARAAARVAAKRKAIRAVE